MRLFRRSSFGGLVLVNSVKVESRDDGSEPSKRQSDGLLGGLVDTANATLNDVGGILGADAASGGANDGNDKPDPNAADQGPDEGAKANATPDAGKGNESTTDVAEPDAATETPSSAPSSTESVAESSTTPPPAPSSSSIAPTPEESSTPPPAAAVAPSSAPQATSTPPPAALTSAASPPPPAIVASSSQAAPVATTPAAVAPVASTTSQLKSVATIPAASKSAAAASTFETFTLSSKIFVSTQTSVANGRTTLIPVTTTAVSSFSFSTTFTPLAESAVQGTNTATDAAATNTDSGDVNGLGSTVTSGSVPSETAATGKGSLNVTSSSNAKNQTTIAVSIAVIIAGAIALSLGAYFLIRRYLRKRTINAESPPPSPLLNKFNPTRLPASPLPAVNGKELCFDQAKWDSQTSNVEWGEKGHNRYGSDGSSMNDGRLSPLPPALARSGTGASNRETMRVFPNGRQKLGGKDFPSNF